MKKIRNIGDWLKLPEITTLHNLIECSTCDILSERINLATTTDNYGDIILLPVIQVYFEGELVCARIPVELSAWVAGEGERLKHPCLLRMSSSNGGYSIEII